MGRTSVPNSRLNLPGRYAWAVAEAVGPLNMLFIIYTLPSRVLPPAAASSAASLLGTGMPFFYSELLALLYLLHYLNRAVISPLFLAPSLSPISLPIAVSMALFQYTNSSCLSCWIVYHYSSAAAAAAASSSSSSSTTPLLSPLLANPYPILFALPVFALGLYGNVCSDLTLFALRRAAARRRAKSEGKSLHDVSYEKVYAVPEPEGWFKHVMYPHYAMEWLEWTGYWMLGGLAGLGWWGTPALWFLVNEVTIMTPRAVGGWRWYERRFGKKALAGRDVVLPGVL